MVSAWKKLLLKYPLDVTGMQEMDSRNENFLGGMPPTPPPLDGRAYGAWCAFGTRRVYGTLSTPLQKSGSAPDIGSHKQATGDNVYISRKGC